MGMVKWLGYRKKVDASQESPVNMGRTSAKEMSLITAFWNTRKTKRPGSELSLALQQSTTKRIGSRLWTFAQRSFVTISPRSTGVQITEKAKNCIIVQGSWLIVWKWKAPPHIFSTENNCRSKMKNCSQQMRWNGFAKGTQEISQKYVTVLSENTNNGTQNFVVCIWVCIVCVKYNLST